MLGQFVAQAQDFSQLPARPSPAWVRDGVVYEIFPRDFSPAGNLKSITARLDELQDLGVTVLWIMPIQPIGKEKRKGEYGSPYSISDYYAVDPNYGTLDDFKQLVTQAHQRNLRVILDVVLNHTAWDSVLRQHPDFYLHDAQGNVISPDPGWTDVAGLNYANPQLRQYMIGVMKYWLKTCDLDGFRCDVAWGVPTDFWEEARTQLDAIKPGIMMLAEANKPELMVKAFDLDYDWPLMGTLNDVLIDGSPASNLGLAWEKMEQDFPRGTLHMQITDDHDEARAITRYGVRGALAGSALMFTLDGVPMIYNGMEVGDATESGDPALFSKLPIFWSPRDRPDLRKIYHSLIQLRKDQPAFRDGSVTWLHNSDENSVVTFERADGQDQFVVLINFSNRPIKETVDIPDAENFIPVQIDGLPPAPNGDFPSVHLGGYDWRIYHRTLPSVVRVVAGASQPPADPPAHQTQ
jgi:glycosidase